MIPYVIKVIMCSALFFVLYKFLLENEKVHRFKRFYLLCSLLLSFTIPLFVVNIEVSKKIITKNPIIGLKAKLPSNKEINENVIFDIEKAPINTEIITENIELHEQTTEKVFSITETLIIVYCIVVFLLFIHFIVSLFSILFKSGKAQVIVYKKAKLVLIDQKQNPHSFFNFIFLNKDDFNSGLIQNQVLVHELTHVRQRHSLDIIFIRMLEVFFWFNPLIFLYKKAILLNHEFLADESVIKECNNTNEYLHLLIGWASKPSGSALVSEFNFLTTKKRLIMMRKTKSPVKALFKQITIIPILGLMILSFSIKVIAQEKKESANEISPFNRTDTEVIVPKVQQKKVGVTKTTETKTTPTAAKKEKQNTNSPKAIIKGIVYCELGMPIQGAAIVYKDNKILCNNNGEYQINDVTQNTSYAIKAIGDKYFSDVKGLEIEDFEDGQIFETSTGSNMDFYLEKIYDTVNLELIEISMEKIRLSIKRIMIEAQQFELSSIADIPSSIAYFEENIKDLETEIEEIEEIENIEEIETVKYALWQSKTQMEIEKGKLELKKEELELKLRKIRYEVSMYKKEELRKLAADEKKLWTIKNELLVQVSILGF